MTEPREANDSDASAGFVRIFSDQPLTDAAGLAFKFEGLARTLAELAWNPQNATPFTAVVRGSWGRGKTTLLRQTRRLLDDTNDGADRRQVRTLWFNVWKYPSEDTVLAGLLGVLLDAFRQGSMLDQLAFHVGNHKEHVAQAVLHAAAPWAFGKPGDSKAWTGQYDRLYEKRAFHDVFRDLFLQASYQLFHRLASVRDLTSRRPEDLWDTQAQSRYAVAIFLDDLDRCRPARVLEVLEAINLFLDLPGVCFYLGLDMERLEDLLPAEFGAHKGRFLEKIIQISLELPEVSQSGVEEYVGGLLAETQLRALLRADGAGGAAGHDDIAIIGALLRSRHPRHVKRFLNDLSLTLAVLRNTGLLGVGDDQLPERAVVGWHLLREALEPARWREVRALTANLGALLRQWSAARAAASASENENGRGPDGWDDALRGLCREGHLDAHIDILSGLSQTQLDLLVHTGSPPKETASRAGLLGGEVAGLVDASSGLGMVWIHIEGGTFWMGSDNGEANEKPAHQVTLAAFEIGRDPVTNAQYSAFVRAKGVKPPDHWVDGQIPAGKEHHPVVNVSWHDARAFCDWLGNEQAAPVTRIRLLTEAEWEYAARGSEGRDYPWGSEPPDEKHCNFGGKVGDTTPVGSYPFGATPRGVNDLAGNVWEWIEDAWHISYPGAPTDGSAWLDTDAGAGRVIRGGSWINVARVCRSTYRLRYVPNNRDNSLGFRCTRVQA